MRCLVTGASRGIGWAVAQQLAKRGDSVILSASNQKLLADRLETLSCGSPNQRHTVLPCDLSEDIPSKIDFGGPVNAFVHCGAMMEMKLLVGMDVPTIRKMLKVDLEAPMLLARLVVSAMLKQRAGGSLVFLSSVLASRPGPGTAVYNSAKAGIETFTRSLAREVGPRQIRVNAVSPGLTATDMGYRANQETAMASSIFPGLIPVEEVAASILQVLDNRHMTGSIVQVDNGFTA